MSARTLTLAACLALGCGGSSATTSSTSEAGATSSEAGAAMALGDGPRASLTAPDGGGGAGGGAGGAGGAAGAAGSAGGAGGSAAGDAGPLADAPLASPDAAGADGPKAIGADAAVAWGDWRDEWMFFNAGSSPPSQCRCDGDKGWSCYSFSGAPELVALRDVLASSWYPSLAKLCDGRAEGAACSGAVAGAEVMRVPISGFSINAGTCRAGRCCPGCWDGQRCRTTFANFPVRTAAQPMPTKHKQWDFVAWGPPGDWHYFCGSGGEVCAEGKGDADGLMVCKTGGQIPSNTCPDKILP